MLSIEWFLADFQKEAPIQAHLSLTPKWSHVYRKIHYNHFPDPEGWSHVAEIITYAPLLGLRSKTCNRTFVIKHHQFDVVLLLFSSQEFKNCRINCFR